MKAAAFLHLRTKLPLSYLVARVFYIWMTFFVFMEPLNDGGRPRVRLLPFNVKNAARRIAGFSRAASLSDYAGECRREKLLPLACTGQAANCWRRRSLYSFDGQSPVARDVAFSSPHRFDTQAARYSFLARSPMLVSRSSKIFTLPAQSWLIRYDAVVQHTSRKIDMGEPAVLD